MNEQEKPGEHGGPRRTDANGGAGAGVGPDGAAAPPTPENAGERPIRVVVAKPGLDGHDRGIKIVARALRDAGMEVVYTGLHQTPEQIVSAALAEDADAIGLSVLSGAHLTQFRRVVELLNTQDAADIVVFGGGIIPAGDLPELAALGVHGIFTPGAPTHEIVDWLRAAVAPRLAAGL